MKTAPVAAVLAALLPLSGADLTLVKKDNPSVLHTKTHRRRDIENPVEHDRKKHGYRHAITPRQNVVSTDLANDVTLYYINVTLGTPAQSFALHIDTGSSDLWVNTASSKLCQRNPRVCEETGTYSSSASSTYTLVNNDFNVTYADGSAAVGPYVTDSLGVGSLILPDFQFGVGETSSSPQGILGIGYPTNEGVVQTSTRLIYPNLPEALANAGAINSVAYSLWLDDLAASTGTLLFGGINTAKFTGSLNTFPILKEYGVYAEFFIAMTGIGLNGKANSIASGQQIPVLLDSGTSLTYLPNSLAEALFAQYNTQYSQSQGAAPVPCSLGQESGSVDFTFSSLTISVPLSELVINLSSNPNSEVCAFGIAPSGGSGLSVLGDTFLRSAYVVYDLSNNEISMAQTNTNPGADNIVEIQSGSAGVPSATGASGALSTASLNYASASGPVGNVGPTSFALSATATGSQTHTASSSSTRNAAAAMKTTAPLWKYGGGLAAGAAALAIL